MLQSITTIIFLSYLATLIYMLLTTTMPSIVLLLVTTFVHFFIFLLLLDAEFLSIGFLIVYIGAVAVLFVFALMVTSMGQLLKRDKLSTINLISIAIITHLIYSTNTNFNYRLSYDTLPLFYLEGIYNKPDMETFLITSYDILIFGKHMYTTHKTLFFVSGFLLLVAITGVIALTMPSDKKQ